MFEYILKFGNGNAVLVDGKCVLYKVEFESFENRRQIAGLMFEKYRRCFSSIGEVLRMMRVYEKNGDFIINKHCAYILHDAR